MRVFLVEQDDTHLVADAWGLGMTRVEGDDIIGGRKVMSLLGIAGTSTERQCSTTPCCRVSDSLLHYSVLARHGRVGLVNPRLICQTRIAVTRNSSRDRL